MTRSQIKELVKKELFRRIDKGGTCFGPHIDHMAFVVQKAAGTLLHEFPSITTKQEINLYGCAIEDAVEFFLSHASLEVKCEKPADN